MSTMYPAPGMSEPQTIGFDIYGTLVDPLAIASVLQTYAGNQASRFAELWREKQVEYAFRRGLMRNYEPFDVCTRDALAWLVSANPWDVIGAKPAGLRAAWLNRGGTKTFDPWGIIPDATLTTLGDLARFFSCESGGRD